MQVLFKAQQRLDEKEKQVEAMGDFFRQDPFCRVSVGTMAEQCGQGSSGAGMVGCMWKTRHKRHTLV